MIRTGFLSLAMVVLSALPALADPILINNTGATGWEVSYEGGPYSAATVTTKHPAWTAGSGAASWLGKWEEPWPAGGLYSYLTTFDLTGFDLSTAQLTFQAASDDVILDVLLNGVSLSPAFTFSGFAGLSPSYTINSGFDPGQNTLEFVVRNNANGPTGLLVEFDGSADLLPAPPSQEVPEPASLAVWGLVTMVGSAVAYRRRRKALPET